jgi:predicted nuclease of predicted toxin-antitoxin system
MIKLVTDENFNNDILRGVLRQNPDIDIVRIQDVGLSGVNDQNILEWSAHENRVLLTHDISTITRYAYERVQANHT